MKNILKILSLAFLATLVLSCEETEFDKTSDYERIGNYVAFEVESAAIDENSVSPTADGETKFGSNTYQVSLFRSTTDLSAPLTVSIDLENSFLSDSDFANAGDDASTNFGVSTDVSTVEIPAGEEEISFYVTTVNNTIATGDISIVMTITGTSDASYRLGRDISEVGKTISLTIVDDDCPFNADKLTGTFTATQIDLDGNGNSTAEGTYEVTITQDAGNPLLLYVEGLVSGLYGTVDDGLVPLNLVTCKKGAVYPAGSPMGIYNPTGDFITLERRDGFFAGEAGPAFEQNGLEFPEESSWVSYDDETGKITIYGWLSVPALGSFGAKQFELTKVE